MNPARHDLKMKKLELLNLPSELLYCIADELNAPDAQNFMKALRFDFTSKNKYFNQRLERLKKEKMPLGAIYPFKKKLDFEETTEACLAFEELHDVPWSVEASDIKYSIKLGRKFKIKSKLSLCDFNQQYNVFRFLNGSHLAVADWGTLGIMNCLTGEVTKHIHPDLKYAAHKLNELLFNKSKTHVSVVSPFWLKVFDLERGLMRRVSLKRHATKHQWLDDNSFVVGTYKGLYMHDLRQHVRGCEGIKSSVLGPMVEQNTILAVGYVSNKILLSCREPECFKVLDLRMIRNNIDTFSFNETFANEYALRSAARCISTKYEATFMGDDMGGIFSVLEENQFEPKLLAESGRVITAVDYDLDRLISLDESSTCRVYFPSEELKLLTKFRSGQDLDYYVSPLGMSVDYSKELNLLVASDENKGMTFFRPSRSFL